MKKILEKITFRQKLYLYTLAVLLLFLTLALVFLFTNKEIHKLNNYSQSVAKLDKNYLLLAKQKQKFSETVTENISFFESGEDKSLTEYYLLRSDVEKILADLQTNDIQTEVFDELLVLNRQNDDWFIQYVNMVKERGYGTYGLTGQISNTIEIIKKRAEDSDLAPKINALLSYQQSYFLNYDNSFLYRFNQLFKEIASDLNMETGKIIEVDSLRRKKVVNAAKDSSKNADSLNSGNILGKNIQLGKQLYNYKESLNSLIELSLEIGVTENEGVRGKMKYANNKTQELLGTFEKTFEEQLKAQLRFRFLFTVIVSILLILIFVALSYQLFTYLLGVSTKLSNQIQSLAFGEFPKPLKIRNPKDELSFIYEKINAVSSGLHQKLNFIKEIAQGRKDENFTILSENDQLGIALLQLQSDLEKRKEEEELLKREESERNYINIGLTRFADILRKNNDLKELGYQIIHELIVYLKVNQGGIFYLNDEKESDIYLEMIASYAYDRRKYYQKKMALGEGLVGVCAKEMKTSYYTNIPDHYIEVTSGLGKSTPKYLLIVPLVYEDKVHGVVELASFKPIEKYQIEFIEHVSESTATTFSSMKANLSNALLLEQFRLQSDAIAAQEEEMRQNLEELLAANEDMERKEHENDSFLEALGQAVLIAEFDLYGNISRANELFLIVNQITNSSLQDTNFLNVVQLQNINEETFWKQLLEGKNIRQYSQKKIQDKITYYLEGFIPIQNREEKISKILYTACDISDFKNMEF